MEATVHNYIKPFETAIAVKESPEFVFCYKVQSLLTGTF